MSDKRRKRKHSEMSTVANMSLSSAAANDEQGAASSTAWDLSMATHVAVGVNATMDTTIDLTSEDDVYKAAESDEDVVCMTDPSKIRRVQVSDSPPPQIVTVVNRATVKQPPPPMELAPPKALPPPKPAVPKTPVPPTPTPHNSKSLKCAVCLDDFDTILKDQTRKLMSTKCGHIFCQGCLTDCLRVQKVCPTCRVKLAAKTAYHQIFF